MQGGVEVAAAAEADDSGSTALAPVVQGVVATIGDDEYDSLEGAFLAAEEGDTIVMHDHVSLDKTIIIERRVTLDLNKKMLEVSINGAAAATSSAFEVLGNGALEIKDGFIFGPGKGKDNRAIKVEKGGEVKLTDAWIGRFHAETGNGGAVCLESGKLEVLGGGLGFWDETSPKQYGEDAGNFALNGGAVWASDSNVSISNDTEFGCNKSADTTGNAREPWHGGGAVYVEGMKSGVSLRGAWFYQNVTDDHGGAIHLDDVGDAQIADNIIQDSGARNSSMPDRRGGDGAGIYIRQSTTVSPETPKLNVTGNTIQGGKATGSGGGVCIVAAKGDFVLDGNKILKNESGSRGGGISMGMVGTSTIDLKSGRIENNKAREFGGGIDYTQRNASPLHLRSVLITENKAVRGAGVWACPASQTKSYSTLGGSIYGNKAEGKLSAMGALPLDGSGDEVRYEGGDTDDSFVIAANPADPNSIMTVAKRALGGGLMSWYTDSPNDRYGDGDIEADPSVYTEVNKSFGLHGDLAQVHKELSEKEAQLVIKGNESERRGGGIASNSPITIGMKDADVTVRVKKEWAAADHPDEVTVDLFRLGPDNRDRVKLDEGVVLNETNGWESVFTDLPSRYVDADGVERECTYEVVERRIDGWTCESKVEYDGDARTYVVTLVNSLEPKSGSLEVSKTVSGSGASKSREFTFTVELSEKLDGTYGQMEFVGGVSTFKLRHGEKVEAIGLPAGANYVVSESDNDGYTVSSNGATGQIVADSTAVASFENHKDGSGGGGVGGGVSVTVKKVWVLDDGSKPTDSVTIELLRDGKRYDTALLNASCGWSRTWNGLSSGYKWTVAEVDVPEGFKASVSREGGVWTVINDDIPGSPDPEPDPDPDPSPAPDPEPEPSPDPEPDPDPSLDSKPGQGQGANSGSGSSAIPSTGDHSGIFVVAAAVTGILLLIAGGFWLKRGRKGRGGL